MVVFSKDASITLCTAAMVNDIDPKNKPNCKMKKEICKDGQPKLCLYAICDIKVKSSRETETVSQYLAELRQMIEHCDFGEFLDESLRDMLVCGLCNTHIQRKLLSEDALTLKSAFHSVYRWREKSRQTEHGNRP